MNAKTKHNLTTAINTSINDNKTTRHNLKQKIITVFTTTVGVFATINYIRNTFEVGPTYNTILLGHHKFQESFYLRFYSETSVRIQMLNEVGNERTNNKKKYKS